MRLIQLYVWWGDWNWLHFSIPQTSYNVGKCSMITIAMWIINETKNSPSVALNGDWDSAIKQNVDVLAWVRLREMLRARCCGGGNHFPRWSSEHLGISPNKMRLVFCFNRSIRKKKKSLMDLRLLCPSRIHSWKPQRELEKAGVDSPEQASLGPACYSVGETNRGFQHPWVQNLKSQGRHLPAGADAPVWWDFRVRDGRLLHTY